MRISVEKIEELYKLCIGDNPKEMHCFWMEFETLEKIEQILWNIVKHHPNFLRMAQTLND